ncbi:voltage-gated monoatomic cation channel TMEM109 [Opisthocomus hoazin]|uniref:voltage-gated monoatomic cation channel TMEM109 n=1 Tax=Opisthocomus hoazin TaxID=30419 RepID=UPI003F53774A
MADAGAPRRRSECGPLRLRLRFRFRFWFGFRAARRRPRRPQRLTRCRRRHRKRKRSRRAPRRGTAPPGVPRAPPRGHAPPTAEGGARCHRDRVPACNGARRLRTTAPVVPRGGARPFLAVPARSGPPGSAAPPRGGETPGPEMGGRRWALLALLLCTPFPGARGAEDPRAGSPGRRDPLSELGRAAWETLESWLGPQPLRLVAESLWVVSSGVSAVLTALAGILGDLLAVCGVGGDRPMLGVTLGPGEVQRVLLWGLAAAAGSRLLGGLRGVLLPAWRWVKVGLFWGAFLHVASSPENPTVQAAMMVGLWVIYALLGRLGGAPDPNARLDAAVRSLEWKVEELRRRQKWGGPRNREE